MEGLELLTFSNKQAILSLFQSDASGSKIHSTKISCVSEFEEVNKALYEWYLLTCFKNIFPGGPQLTEKAKQTAERLENRSSKVQMGGRESGSKV